jgi:SecDF, P1 head subdomain
MLSKTLCKKSSIYIYSYQISGNKKHSLLIGIFDLNSRFTDKVFIINEGSSNMKSLIIIFIIITSSLNIFSQIKTIETGLYLVISPDSCTKQTNKNTIVYLSDTLCLEEKPVITVNDIESSNTGMTKLDGNELYVLNIALKESAKLKFKAVTEQNVGKRMVIVIDNQVVMAAVIRDPVTTGRLTVSGEKEQVIKELGIELNQEMNNR